MKGIWKRITRFFGGIWMGLQIMRLYLKHHRRILELAPSNVDINGGRGHVIIFLLLAKEEQRERKRFISMAMFTWAQNGYELAIFKDYPLTPEFKAAAKFCERELLASVRNGGPALLDYAENGTPLPL